jgi:FtsP/CotA-like multicopper oxidase with cupredoxin domain
MTHKRNHSALLLLLAGLAVVAAPASADFRSQCPTGNNGSYADNNGDGMIRAADGEIKKPLYPRQVCMHLGAGDGFAVMADGHSQYTFGFSNLTGKPIDQTSAAGMLAAEIPAPTIVLDEEDRFYLTLSNVGMLMRPDLFDPHSVHWHGFPEAAPVFDGVPESSITINMGSILSYFYQVNDPGTYMYHCHVEATEHMAMGMLGNLYVRPKQNRLANNTVLAGGFVHQNGFKYAYNDGDGSTRYDVEAPVQMTSFDGNFHDEHLAVQALPFYLLRDDYPMLNGRGYPDTVNPAALAPSPDNPEGKVSQKVNAIVTAAAGQKILLRISNLSVTKYFTLGTLGLRMKVIGRDARLLRGPDPDGTGPALGKNLYYETNSITLGGGESTDVLVDTAGVAPGTYFLYTTNLNYLANGQEDLGGMLTEIRIQ